MIGHRHSWQADNEGEPVTQTQRKQENRMHSTKMMYVINLYFSVYVLEAHRLIEMG